MIARRSVRTPPWVQFAILCADCKAMLRHQLKLASICCRWVTANRRFRGQRAERLSARRHRMRRHPVKVAMDQNRVDSFGTNVRKCRVLLDFTGKSRVPVIELPSSQKGKPI